jgi:3-dehydroquinate dehydratase-2
MRERFRSVNISFFQSNIEGELIDRIQVDSMQTQGIIINPGGYAHTSVAIRDAIAAVECPVIEVHISNLYGREEFRKNCITAGACVGVISGLGLRGYAAALEFLIQS